MTDFEIEFARRSALSHAMAMAPCLHDHFMEMRETAELSLIRQLPDVKPEDRDWIDVEEMRALINALDIDRPDLTLAILNALEQVGEIRAIPWVEALARGLERGDARRPHARLLRVAAGGCLERLREQAARTKQSQTLLRGSTVPTGREHSTLLRPVNETAATPPTELLRPSQTDS